MLTRSPIRFEVVKVAMKNERRTESRLKYGIDCRHPITIG